MAHCLSPQHPTPLSQPRQISVSPGGWKPRLPDLMPLVLHPPSSGASISVTQMPSAAASSPLRGPRKLAAIKQVRTKWSCPLFPSLEILAREEGIPGYCLPTVGHADPSIFAGRGREDWGSPLTGKMILPRLPFSPSIIWVVGLLTPILALPQVLSQPVLVTGLCLLPETLLTFPPDSHVLPTVSADAQRCPHLDTSWQGSRALQSKPSST